ncbi:hypothetical protein MYMA111404_02175 [Mycoplasma marinum]|uniref:HNH endonuclease n=1 Tax=Mycoplasma marinum TaxID=1937190 RepID=A0A4R0XUI5_9MOLU|nr:hypothetical protein [Mycoplasma marinum]TCG11349.1 hypothetical protein C4B24_02240 [Mycoplasma marinum]
MGISKNIIEWILIPKSLPSSPKYINPQTWMGPQMWSTIKKEVFKRADYSCEVCGGQGTKDPVEAHELWVFDYHTKERVFVRFLALCPLCHWLQHMGLASIRITNHKLDQKELVEHFNKLTNSDLTFERMYERAIFVYKKIKSKHYEISLDKDREPLLKLWKDN